MRFWIFYYALFGSRSTRRALGFVVLALTFFFYCFTCTKHSLILPVAKASRRCRTIPGQSNWGFRRPIGSRRTVNGLARRLPGKAKRSVPRRNC